MFTKRDTLGNLYESRGFRVNESEGDYDSWVKDSSGSYLFYVDASAGCIGVGTSTPDSLLELRSSDALTVLKVHSTAADGAARLLLQNDAQTWGLRIETDDSFAIFSEDLDAACIAIAADGTVTLNMLDVVGEVTFDGSLVVEGSVDVADTLVVNTITEYGAGVGVTIETVPIKDGLVDGIDVSAIPTTYLALTGGSITGDVYFFGVGANHGELRVYDTSDVTYTILTTEAGKGYICTEGTAPAELCLQDTAHDNVKLFNNAAANETQELKIYGYRTGDALRSLQIGVGVDAADTASFDGVSNYWFDGAVETVGNMEVGGDLGINCTPSYALSIGSTDGSDQVGIYHNNSHSYFRTTDGHFIFQTAEGTNTDSVLGIYGLGTGIGDLRLYDQDSNEHLNLYCYSGYGFVKTTGATPGALRFQHSADVDIWAFDSAAEGETRELKIYGYRTGDAKRSLEIGVGTDAADTASFDGLNDYWFNGNVEVVGEIEADTAHIGGATHYSAISGTGALTMAGNARVYSEIWIGASGLKAPGTKPAEWNEHGISGVWVFTDDTDDTLVANMRIPHRMDRTVAPTVAIGWSSNEADNECVWQLEYLWTSPDEDTTANAQETLSVTDAASSQNDGLVVSEITGIDLPSGTDACIHMRIKRLGADGADTLTSDVMLHGICMQFVTDKLGTALT